MRSTVDGAAGFDCLSRSRVLEIGSAYRCRLMKNSARWLPSVGRGVRASCEVVIGTTAGLNRV